MNENCWARVSLPEKPVADRSIDCGEVVKTSSGWGQFEPEYQTLAGLTHPRASAWINRWPPWSAPLHTAQRTYKVEILKFAEPPKRSSGTSTKKRGGIMPLLAVVVSVAVVGGMSTTLAGTISLNTGGSVEFGQGVVTTAACDATIKILPASSFDSSTSTFSVSSITLQEIGIKSNGSDTATAGAGCLNKRLTLRAYDSNGGALKVNSAATQEYVQVEIPDSSTVAAAGTFTYKSSFAGITGAGGFSSNATTVATGTVDPGYFTVTGLKISGTVTRITLESSEVQGANSN